MANTAQYYANIRTKLVELTAQFPSGDCVVMSIDNLDRNSKAGNLCEVPLNFAARVIVESTHRLATKEEYAAFKESHERARGQIAKAQALAAQRQVAAVLGTGPVPMPMPEPVKPAK